MLVDFYLRLVICDMQNNNDNNNKKNHNNNKIMKEKSYEYN